MEVCFAYPVLKLCWFPFVYCYFEILRFSRHLISFDVRSQIFGPRNLIFSVPLKTTFTEGIRKHDLCLS